MDIKLYKKFVAVTKTLATISAPSGVFQEQIEKKLNSINYDDFLVSSGNKITDNTKYYIRLKSPESRNSKERGLKVCLFNDNIFEEKSVAAGTTLFEFDPMIKVIGLTNDNCAQCGKFLFDIGESKTGDLSSTEDADNSRQQNSIKCSDCEFRSFCSLECKIKAMLDWHSIECQFIEHIRKELVVVNCDHNGKKQGWVKEDLELDAAFEKIILLIITVFRLLVCLAKDDDKKLIETVSHMSDHMILFRTFIQTGKTECPEHNLLFKETKNTFAPLIKTFFEKQEKKLITETPKLKFENMGAINENGIFRACLLVFVNVSSAMDYFNNSFGMMFDPMFSMINHSCEPNCALIWKDNGQILVKNIKKLKASSEIFLNYVPVHMPREMRQKQLKASFFFDCECYKCSVADRKFDSMLPINCYYCEHLNKGFLLENFAVVDNLPRVPEKILCTNCDNIINAKELFTKYLTIFRFYKGLNPDIEEIEDLCNWGIDSSNIVNMNDIQFNKSVSLFKECYSIVPFKSWPMNLLINIVKSGLQKRDPTSINLLRLTYLSNFLVDNMLEKRCVFKNTIGASLYDLAVVSADYLFDQYLLFKDKTDSKVIQEIGMGAFSLCILSYKHLKVRFANNLIEDTNQPTILERSQKDMVSLSGEILGLLKHFNKENEIMFSQTLLHNAVEEFEKKMDCGACPQLRHVMLPLCEDDYTLFGVVPAPPETAPVVETEQTSAAAAAGSGPRAVQCFFQGGEWIRRL